MKKVIWLLGCLLLIPFAVQAQDVDVSMPIEAHKGTTEQALTNEVINLYGPEAEASFYYTLDADVKGEGYYAELYMTSSSLLIEPSSVTVLVDNRPVTTTTLAGKEEHQLVIPLVGDALQAGTHEIRIQFSGTIVHGVCVAQESSGNWLTIGINSYLHMPTDSTVNALDIAAYPEIYTGNKQHTIQVVMPAERSAETYDSALQIASYLTSISEENSVMLVTEKDVQKLNGNVIIVGVASEFKTDVFKNIVTQTKSSDDALTLAQYRLVNGEEYAYALIVTAEDAKTLSARAHVLTVPALYGQLAGQTLALQLIPKSDPSQNDTHVTFETLGMPNITLNKTNNDTQTYFYYVPNTHTKIVDPALELHLKLSDTITSYVDLAQQQDTTLLQEQPVELIVHVNGVPHAIDLQTIEVDELQEARVTLPIDEATIGETQLISVQVTTKGLRVQNPCVATDYDRWVYMYNDSRLVLPQQQLEEQPDMYFNRFPYPFVASSEEAPLTIVAAEDVSTNELVRLYEILRTSNATPPTKLVDAKDVKEEDLAKGHVIVIGNPVGLPALEKDALAIPYDKTAKLEEQGFIPVANTSFAFIQPSVWNKDYTMVVFDKVKTAEMYVPASLSDYIRSTDAQVSTIVSNGPELIFTSNEVNKDGQAQQGERVEQNEAVSTTAIALLVLAALLICGLIIWVLYKRQKRQGM